MTVTVSNLADGVWQVTLNRPEQANALSADLVETLHGVLDDAARSKPAALVLRGNQRHFCAGFDLTGLDRETDGSLARRFLRIALLLERLVTAPYTTVAAVEGAAVGAGADLVTACDHRVGTSAASFRFPGAAFGVILGRQRLTDIVGHDAARELADGTRLDADRALAIGLLSRLATTGSVEAEVLHMAYRTPPTPSRVTDTSADVAALARSVSVPGLQDRLTAYAGVSRLSPRAHEPNNAVQIGEKS